MSLPKPSVKKNTNPKDAVGTKKVPFSTVPSSVIAEIGLAMLEGARKYRRHNYRAVGIRYSVYYDAAMRHLTAWWEGEDIDPDSGLSHITKALSTLAVLRDAMIVDKFTDDRPPRLPSGWVGRLNTKAREIIERYPGDLEPYTAIGTAEAAQYVVDEILGFPNVERRAEPRSPVAFGIGDTIKDITDGILGDIVEFAPGTEGEPGARVQWHSIGLTIWYPLAQLALVARAVQGQPRQ